MVGEPLASVLRSGRDVFNAKFVQARRRYPTLDGNAFSRFLESGVDPVARALPLRGDAFASWVQSAYDVALELVGEGAVGQDGKRRLLERAWLEILPRLSAAVLASGDLPLGALSNAVHQLAHARGARVEDWISGMKQVAPSCETVDDFLKLGQVLAWRAGMAHYRKSALEIAAGLPERLSRAALGVTANEDLKGVFQRLENDLWFDPRAGLAAENRLRLIKKVGAFRGFGGEFISPPIVATSDGQLFVRSGEEAWLLIADVFGASLHRASAADFEAVRRSEVPAKNVRVTPRAVAVDQAECAIELPGTITSYVVLPHTVAVTSSHTHAVQLLAR